MMLIRFIGIWVVLFGIWQAWALSTGHVMPLALQEVWVGAGITLGVIVFILSFLGNHRLTRR